MGGCNDVLHRSIGLMMEGGNTSWDSMSGSEMMAMMRYGFYLWRRESEIIIMQILTPRQYSCSVLALFRLKKDSSIGKKMSGYWRAACIQRSIRGFVMSQEESTQPREYSAF